MMALLAMVGGPIVASLGGLSVITAVLPFLKIFRRFKGPILILAGIIAIAAVGLVAKHKHDAAIEDLRATANEVGRSGEETKWRLAAAKLVDRHNLERAQDEATLRTITLERNDALLERAALWNALPTSLRFFVVLTMPGWLVLAVAVLLGWGWWSLLPAAAACIAMTVWFLVSFARGFR